MSVAGGLGFAAVSVGGTHTCGVTTGGAAYCWGDNGYGQLGDGTTTQRPSPVRVAGALTFRAVSAGSSHTCGLTTTRLAYCWGDNFRGALGDGTGVSSSVPVLVVQ